METQVLDVILEIRDLLKHSSPSWVPALFTLLGAFIAGFLQYLNSKENLKNLTKTKELGIKSEVISKQRQQWMGEIRKISSIFLAEYDTIVGDMGKDRLTPEAHHQLYKSTNEKGNFIIINAKH